MTTAHVMACIDGSVFAPTVCDYAAWASLRLDVPLTFVHVLDKERATQSDLSGNIGLGSREHLLEELATLDEKRAKIAQEQGRLMLDAAVDRARADGVADVHCRQRNGELVETLTELEGDIRLLVLGKRGESNDEHLGSNLERVVRALHRNILITTGEFRTPEQAMIAFDNSATTRRGIETLAASPLLKGLECHLVTVGIDSEAAREGLPWAREVLGAAGLDVTTATRAGHVEEALDKYVKDNAIDLIVMGAYGHSRIRHLLVGSTTTAMMRKADVPVLLMR
ncbi:universal stress protein [Phytohalomonas tamaricis]|uniref:universal stress protein n=1 Tax=Phytohalomonas tamaricis TaxID=2081032 RepID=UPI000D0B80B1|nr:universal stress protein [Phytohalomonas tamaricis]